MIADIARNRRNRGTKPLQHPLLDVPIPIRESTLNFGLLDYIALKRRSGLLRWIAHRVGGLRRQELRPGHAGGGVEQIGRAEVKELAHIARWVLPEGIARAQGWNVEGFLDECEDRCVVPRRV